MDNHSFNIKTGKDGLGITPKFRLNKTGKYKVNAYYNGNNIFYSSKDNNTIILTKLSSKFTLYDLKKDYVYNSSLKFKVKLTDKNNKVLKNQSLSIVVLGKQYNLTKIKKVLLEYQMLL